MPTKKALDGEVARKIFTRLSAQQQAAVQALIDVGLDIHAIRARLERTQYEDITGGIFEALDEQQRAQTVTALLRAGDIEGVMELYGL